MMSSDPAPQKRKRRSPKEHDSEDPSQYSTQETQEATQNVDIKSDGDVKSEMEDVKHEQVASAANEVEEKRSRGWFDIVMGDSNELDSSEDEGTKRRR